MKLWLDLSRLVAPQPEELSNPTNFDSYQKPLMSNDELKLKALLVPTAPHQLLSCCPYSPLKDGLLELRLPLARRAQRKSDHSAPRHEQPKVLGPMMNFVFFGTNGSGHAARHCSNIARRGKVTRIDNTYSWGLLGIRVCSSCT